MSKQDMLPAKPKAGTFIDVLSDFGFKRVFASEPNKDLLIAFINELFKGRKTIVDLSYDRNEHVGDTDELGSVVLDLTCTASNGERFVIEVQRSSQFNFKRRMLYYGSKLIADQAPKGSRKRWAYNISEVYVIALLDGFPIPDSDRTNKYLYNICLCDRDTGKVFYDHLEFIYIELINFTKEESALKSDLEGWLFVLKNMSKLDKIPLYLRKPVFEKLFNIAEYSKLNKKEKAMYDTNLKRKWDNQAALDYARHEGMEKGIEKGIEKGVEKGVEKGIEKGAEQKSHEFVKNMLSNTDFSIAKIAALANVPESFVRKVKKGIK